MIEDNNANDDNNIFIDIDNKKVCKLCNVTCNWKSEMKKHLETKGHKLNAKVGKIKLNKNQCICGKEYTHRSSLSYHRQTCDLHNRIKMSIDENEVNNEILNTNANSIIENNRDNNLQVKINISDVQEIINKLQGVIQENLINNLFTNINAEENNKMSLNDTIKQYIKITNEIYKKNETLINFLESQN